MIPWTSPSVVVPKSNTSTCHSRNFSTPTSKFKLVTEGSMLVTGARAHSTKRMPAVAWGASSTQLSGLPPSPEDSLTLRMMPWASKGKSITNLWMAAWRENKSKAVRMILQSQARWGSLWIPDSLISKSPKGAFNFSKMKWAESVAKTVPVGQLTIARSLCSMQVANLKAASGKSPKQRFMTQT